MADNNYYSGDNTNPGFTTGNNTVLGQQGGIPISNEGGFDIGKWLQSIGTYMNTPTTNSNNPLGPVHQAALDGATAGIKKAAQEAAYTGGIPAAQHILSQILPSQQNQKVNSQTQNQKSNQQKEQQLSIDDQISDINKQAQLNLANNNLAQSKAPDFLQRFSQNFTKITGGVTQGEQLQNIGAIQKIAGSEPLQPKDVGELNANSYKAALEATNQSATLESDKIKSLVDLYSKLDANRSVVQKTLGQTSDDQNKVLFNLQMAGKNFNNHINNLSTLLKNRPTFSNKGINKQAQQTDTSIDPQAISEARKRGLIK